jgi:hypothetical protein
MKMAERPMMNRRRPPIADPAMIAGRVGGRAAVEPCKEVTTGVTIVVGTPLTSVTKGVKLLDGVEDTVGVEGGDEGVGVVVEEAGREEETEVLKEEDESDEEEERVSTEVEVEVNEEGS